MSNIMRLGGGFLAEPRNLCARKYSSDETGKSGQVLMIRQRAALTRSMARFSRVRERGATTAHCRYSCRRSRS